MLGGYVHAFSPTHKHTGPYPDRSDSFAVGREHARSMCAA